MTLAQLGVSVAQTASPYPGSDSDESDAYSANATASDYGTSGSAPEQDQSRALTDYLKGRKLPLVGAQVLRQTDGRRLVVLYGFVGSDFGKADAVKKARRFLRDSTVEVDNRISVRPELLASNRTPGIAAASPDSGYPPPVGVPSGSEPSGPSSSPDASAYPGPDSYKAQQASPYVQQFSSMMPLIALLGVLGMGIAGGGSGFSFGTSPFGSSPYGRSYSPYSSPYSSPYGSPYGPPYSGSPFGGSPYGGSPYGTSPYGTSPYGRSPYGQP